MNEDQCQAASSLVSGIVQRIGTQQITETYSALDRVSAGVLVRVELMTVYAAIQEVHRQGDPLTYDSILAEI